ncbi:MAG: C40 family peptidase [Actinobacteria bacterium]|nr:C40 family peptidase [Actinomycetota bacterium]
MSSGSERTCAGDVAPIRAEPRDDSEQVTQAVRGEPLRVEEERGEWARVRTAYDYPGWIRRAALGGAASNDWLGPRREGDPLAEARTFLGAPYEWGGMTQRGIDCSGLVHMAYRRLGHLIPRDADQQEEAGETVAAEVLRPGDLVCYGDHIAFWVGEGRILHSTQRDSVNGVVEEDHPPQLAARVRRYVRFG